jgi:hypothetical protein
MAWRRRYKEKRKILESHLDRERERDRSLVDIRISIRLSLSLNPSYCSIAFSISRRRSVLGFHLLLRLNNYLAARHIEWKAWLWDANETHGKTDNSSTRSTPHPVMCFTVADFSDASEEVFQILPAKSRMIACEQLMKIYLTRSERLSISIAYFVFFGAPYFRYAVRS